MSVETVMNFGVADVKAAVEAADVDAVDDILTFSVLQEVPICLISREHIATCPPIFAQ
jgi:hypothetical protein